MKISCLLPTYNRFPHEGHLVCEAVNSFLNQGYKDKELIVCNDTPGQEIWFNHPSVKILNVPERFETLTHKLRFMIAHADGDAFCRWDDDDISLPWRLALSSRNMEGKDEWRCEKHFYSENNHIKKITMYPGNSHNMSIWSRTVLAKFGNGYPMHSQVMGDEDQTFNRALVQMGYPINGEEIDPKMIFYIYRWGVSSNHLSANMNKWKQIGQAPVVKGSFKIEPQWQLNYVKQMSDYLRAVGYSL
jgi:hypothetical protein